MKKLMLSLAVCCSLLNINCCFAQKYYPLVDTNKLWGIQESQLGSEGWHSFSSYIKFTQDTTIWGFVYKKVMQSYDSLHLKWSGNGYIRETADEKVHYIYINGSLLDSGLLYNFNVKIGDTNILHWTSGGVSVGLIDSVLIGKQFRKRFFVSYKGIGVGETWIEGIGSLCGVIGGLCKGQGVGGYSSLLCCSHNDTLLYGNPEHNYCYQGTVNIKENRKNNFIDIFPNPADNILNIELNNTPSQPFNKSTMLIIYNIEGQVEFEKQILKPKEQIDITKLPQGIYFIKLETNNNISTIKFIKNNFF